MHDGDPSSDDLSRVLVSLRRDHAVRSLLCEGGPTLFRALLGDDLVDELVLTISPVLVGGDELGVIAGASLPSPLTLTLIWAMEHEGNLLLRYARR